MSDQGKRILRDPWGKQMTRQLLLKTSALALLATGAAMTAARADPSRPAPAGDQAATQAVSEIIVTAQRREQSLEKVPVAVTAFTGEERSLVGIKSVQDLTNFTPGLAFNSVLDRPYIRGIGRNTDNLSTTSAVAIYYNNVYDGANSAAVLQKDDLFIGNIEVDRGPQNTLHGSNADGGTINYTSQRPTKSYYAEGRVGIGSYDKLYGEAVVSGPITDNLRFRLGGNYTSESGGYFRNLDGPPEGGDIAQGGRGDSRYLEGQLEANIGHLDAWAMISSGTYSVTNHTQANLGNIPASFSLPGSLSPSSFYGLCAPNLVTIANAAACTASLAAGAAPVLSANTDAITADRFPGNNPGNINQRDFIQEYTSNDTMHNDVALATNLTYHFPKFDVTYLGGYQNFNYTAAPATGNTDSGLTSYNLAGAASPFACQFLLGASAAACTAPLTIKTSPSYTIFGENDDFFSHELDITSTDSSPFQYIVGAYWYHEHFEQPVDAGVTPLQAQLAHPFYLGPLGPACPGGAVLCAAPANPASAISTSDTRMNYDDYAGFASGSYKFDDHWQVSGGIRWTGDQKEGVQTWRLEAFDVTPGFQSTTFGSATPALDITEAGVGAAAVTAYPGAGKATLNPATGNWERALNATWSAWTGEADVDWTPTDHTLFYAKYSRGYKSGGFDTFSIGAFPETQAEFVDAYEVGGKDTFGSQFLVNWAAFFYDYHDDQVPLTVQGAAGTFVSNIYNVPDVHDFGFELEGVWRPTDALTVSAQYSYLSAKVASTDGQCVEDTTDPTATQPGANTAGCKQTPGSPIVQNIVGQYLPEATPNKVSLNALYTFRFDPGKLTLSGSFVWKDTTYASFFNRWYNQQPNYTQVNLRATWADASNRYNIIAFVDNVFDTAGYDQAGGSLLAPGDVLASPGLTAPRTFGVEFQYRFR
jgi:iron complex outermembrane recepter protein